MAPIFIDNMAFLHRRYSRTCVKRPLSKRKKNVFQDRLLLNASQKYCRMLQREHSAILSSFIKLPIVIKTIVLSIFEWPFYTGFTVHIISLCKLNQIFGGFYASSTMLLH